MPILQQETAKAAAIDQKAFDIGRTFHVDSKLVESAPTYDSIVPSDFR